MRVATRPFPVSPSPRLRVFATLLLAALSFTLTTPATHAATANPAIRPPNIVIIIADDLGYGDVSCYGAKHISTPHIDALAARGLRFTQGYAPSSTCTPSRYAMLTGEYGWRQPPKQTAILDGDAPLAINPGTVTLPALLQKSGYTTALVGKWHLGYGDGQTAIDFNRDIKPGPLEVGFDSAFYIPATVDRVPTVFIENHRVHRLEPSDPIAVSYTKRIGSDPVGHERPELLKIPADRQHADTIVNGISRIGHMSGGKSAHWVDEDIADVITKRATDFISANRTKPFFLLFGLHDPHVPRAPHPRFRGKSKLGVRGDTILEIDWSVGEITQTLQRLNLAENTLVLFTSDNGPVLFDGYFDRAAEDNNGHDPRGGLRGWKYLRFEAGTRVPMIFTWPARIRPGTTAQLFSLVDLPATFAALTRQKLPATPRDSLNLLPILLGETKKQLRTNVVQHGIGNTLALRSGEWKYIPANPDTTTGIGRGANPADTRFAEARIPEPLLFNLADDPAETKNLAKSHPEKLAQLAAELAALRR